ncbi:MAG TPA: protein phosphatase 2C domain-containing protein [Actinotalea sp.]|nr:protein phosphatase 2C domain-containing protein [Actinotalea sp.]
MSLVDEAAAPIRAAWGAASDVGAVRPLNEDSYIAEFPVFVVADGMGGHEAGERASAEAVDALRNLVGVPGVTARAVQERLQEAQDRVRAIETRPGRGAGTTVTGVVVAAQGGVPYWLVVNLGDSRTYRLSEGVLEQISVDHSEVQEMIEAGTLTTEQAERHPRRHVVTRALGAGVVLDPDFWLLPVVENDRVLVCTDGLTGELSDARIQQVLLAEPDPQVAAEVLVAAAVAAGGRDNVTVLVVDAHDVGDTSDDEHTAPRAAEDEDDDTIPRARVREMGAI